MKRLVSVTMMGILCLQPAFAANNNSNVANSKEVRQQNAKNLWVLAGVFIGAGVVSAGAGLYFQKGLNWNGIASGGVDALPALVTVAPILSYAETVAQIAGALSLVTAAGSGITAGVLGTIATIEQLKADEKEALISSYQVLKSLSRTQERTPELANDLDLNQLAAVVNCSDCKNNVDQINSLNRIFKTAEKVVRDNKNQNPANLDSNETSALIQHKLGDVANANQGLINRVIALEYVTSNR